MMNKNNEPKYAYNYAEIDPVDNMCIGIYTSTADRTGEENLVEIPTMDESYLFKYYINGKWYEDAEGKIPWTPPTA